MPKQNAEAVKTQGTASPQKRSHTGHATPGSGHPGSLGSE